MIIYGYNGHNGSNLKIKRKGGTRMTIMMEKHIKEIWNVFKDLKKEAFYLFFLENNTLHFEKISKNETANSGEIDVEKLSGLNERLNQKEVLAVHNHPYGKSNPSFPDFFQKDYLQSLLRLMNIYMADYSIVSPFGYTSFRDSNLLNDVRYSNYLPDCSVEKVICPKLIVASDVKKQEHKIMDLLTRHHELLVNNREQFGSAFFPGNFLLNKRRDFGSKNIFFYRKQHSEVDFARLLDIERVLEPFEIYVLEDNQLVPIKKNSLFQNNLIQ